MTDKKIPFDKNFKDVSDENGFAFEFYCQNCDKKYRTDFIIKPGGFGMKLTLFKNKITKKGPATEKKLLEKAKKEAFNKSLKEARSHFVKCTRCGNRVCSACWNQAKKHCIACSPKTNDDKSKFEKKREEQLKVKKEAEATTVCPNCGKPHTGEVFCPHCGHNLREELKCPKCGEPQLPNTKFCTKCGAALE